MSQCLKCGNPEGGARGLTWPACGCYGGWATTQPVTPNPVEAERVSAREVMNGREARSSTGMGIACDTPTRMAPSTSAPNLRCDWIRYDADVLDALVTAACAMQREKDAAGQSGQDARWPRAKARIEERGRIVGNYSFSGGIQSAIQIIEEERARGPYNECHAFIPFGTPLVFEGPRQPDTAALQEKVRVAAISVVNTGFLIQSLNDELRDAVKALSAAEPEAGA